MFANDNCIGKSKGRKAPGTCLILDKFFLRSCSFWEIGRNNWLRSPPLRLASHSLVWEILDPKPHPSLVRMHMYKGALLLYGNIHTLQNCWFWIVGGHCVPVLLRRCLVVEIHVGRTCGEQAGRGGLCRDKRRTNNTTGRKHPNPENVTHSRYVTSLYECLQGI